MISRRQAVISSFLALSAGGIGAAAHFLTTEPVPERSDCPGKIICPLTGELVCKDKCPLGAEDVAEPTPEPVGTPSCCSKAE